MRALFFIAFLIFGALKASYAQYTEGGSPEQLNSRLSVQVYPIPASEFVYVKFDSFESQDVRLTVYNIIGNEVNVETERVSDREYRIKVKDLASGYYLLNIRDIKSKFHAGYKFIKR